MGTVVTLCMLSGVVVATRLPVIRKLPVFIIKFVGYILLAAGLWNLLWYGLRHLTEFWGIAALVSGVLMIVTAIYIIDETRLPLAIRKARPIVLLLLLSCALTYGITIARL